MTPEQKRMIELGNQSVMGAKSKTATSPTTPTNNSLANFNNYINGTKPSYVTNFQNNLTNNPTPNQAFDNYINGGKPNYVTNFQNSLSNVPAPTITPTQPNPIATTTTPTQPTTPTTTESPTTQQVTPQAPQKTSDELIKEALEQARQAELAKQIGALSSRYNETISGLQSQRKQAPDKYQSMRVSSDTSSQLQAKNFSEFLANRGLSRSGYARQAESRLQLGLRRELEGINKQEQDYMNYLQQQEDSARRAYNADVASAEQGASSNYYNNFVKELQRQDEARRLEEYQKSQLNMQEKLKGIDTLNKQYEVSNENQQNAIKAFNDALSKMGYVTNPVTGEMMRSIEGSEYDDKKSTNQYKNQFDLSKELGMLPTDLLVNNMTPEQIAYYQSLGDTEGGYASLIGNTDNQTEKALLNYFRNQKISNDADLFQKYGDSMMNMYVPTQSMQKDIYNMQDSDRKFNFDLGKFDYTVNKDNRDFNYQTGRDAVKDQQWGADYGLREFTAKDSSANRWANTSISQQNANTSAQRLANDIISKGSISYESLDKAITDIFKNADEVSNENIDTPWAQGTSSSYRTLGRSEYATIVSSIENSGLPKNKKLLIYNKHNIPLPKKRS